MTPVTKRLALGALCLLASCGAWAAEAGLMGLTRATELRSDKLGTAPVIQSLAADASVRLLSAEGGWALVQVRNAAGQATASGWVRAGALNWKAGASLASTVASGREVAGNTALTLGIRALPARANRHALIIGIGQYADANTPELPGVKFDRESATQIAHSMQVPTENIRYLQNQQATGDGIRQALKELDARVQEGDRVFIHYSGHGTRYLDPAAGGCVEALLAYDGGTHGQISNREIAALLSPISQKSDKLFVMYDACHSGGVAQAQAVFRTRGVTNANDEGALRGKFTSTNEECGRPVNVKTRNLLVEATTQGMLPQDIIHLSASRDNEISFDDENKGGLATQYLRDCMLREATDLDGSGSISIEEIRQCAQQKINKRMSNSATFKPHNLVLNGNADFVPAWFSQQALAAVDVTSPVLVAAPASAVVKPASEKPAGDKPTVVQSAAVPQPTAAATPTPAPTPAPTPVLAPTPAQMPAAAPAPLTGEQALQQLYAQRNAKHGVQVSLRQSTLQIGKDALDLSVRSDKAGFVYLALAGSDNQSMYMLFPNDLDQNNRIEAGQTMQLPRPHWRVRAAGPAGVDNLLVVVADAPRDLRTLAASKAGPFMVSLNDQGGRAQWGNLLTSSKEGNAIACADPAARSHAACSDAFGAALLRVTEVP